MQKSWDLDDNIKTNMHNHNYHYRFCDTIDKFYQIRFALGFPLVGTKGQKFLHCPETKRQQDKLKILPRDETGQDSQNSGWDGPGQPKSGTGKRCSKKENDVLKQEKGVLKQEKDVLKQKKDVLKQKIWSFYLKNFNSFCPGTSRDRGFCPGQRDIGTRKFFCPRTKGQRDVPSRGIVFCCIAA